MGSLPRSPGTSDPRSRGSRAAPAAPHHSQEKREETRQAAAPAAEIYGNVVVSAREGDPACRYGWFFSYYNWWIFDEIYDLGNVYGNVGEDLWHMSRICENLCVNVYDVAESDVCYSWS